MCVIASFREATMTQPLVMPTSIIKQCLPDFYKLIMSPPFSTLVLGKQVLEFSPYPGGGINLR